MEHGYDEGKMWAAVASGICPPLPASGKAVAIVLRVDGHPARMAQMATCPQYGLAAIAKPTATELIVDGDIRDLREARDICAAHPSEDADRALSIIAEFEDDGWHGILGEDLGLARHRAQTGKPPWSG